MIRYLDINELLEIHDRVMQASGGSLGLLSLGALESAVAQPRTVFADEDLYPTLPEKAAALGFSLIQDHPAVASLLDESKYFIEWIAAEVETAAQLVELQVQLACWQRNWNRIWDDPDKRRQTGELSKVWSARVLDHSGLLG